MRWTARVTGGPRRVNHAAAEVNGRIYSFGGYCTGDNYREIDTPIDVFVLNTQTLRWSAVPKPTEPHDPSRPCPWPYQRYGHTVVAYEECVYLFGGRNDESPCNALFKFDTKKLQWEKLKVTGTVPAERDGHTSCVINGFMYVFGGYEETQFRFGLDVYRLNLKELHWERLTCHGDPPIYRDFHSATPVDGDKMVVFGGRSDLSGGMPGQIHGAEFYTNKVHCLDTRTLTWHTPDIEGRQPEGRRSHSALAVDDKLLIFGGFNGRLGKHYEDTWLLDPDTWTWRQLAIGGDGPSARRRQCMCLYQDKIFLFGGTSPYHGPPLLFTAQQLALIPEQDPPTAKLIDHNDLFVLDLNPTLRTLGLLAVIKHDLSLEGLPQELVKDAESMTKPNGISQRLRTLTFPLG